VEEELSNNVTIVSASLSVKGNVTSLSVTMKNEGNSTIRVFGMTLHGKFNATRTLEAHGNGHHDEKVFENIHPETIPFKVNGTSLIPLFGTEQNNNGEHDDETGEGNAQNGNAKHDDENEGIALSSVVLQPGQSITLSFSGIISLQSEGKHSKNPAIVLTPIVDSNYTLRLMGEGFQTYSIVAK
jgi:hypothetical protein